MKSGFVKCQLSVFCCAVLGLFGAGNASASQPQSPVLYLEFSSTDNAPHLIENILEEYGFRHVEVFELESIESLVAKVELKSIAAARLQSLLWELSQDARLAHFSLATEFSVAAAKGLKADGQLASDPYAPLQDSHNVTRVTASQRFSLGRGVKVAIIDTGIDARHVDLSKQIATQLNFVGADQEFRAVEFHATAVAGVIAADGNNGHGIIGVAPKARLYALRACVEPNPGESRGKCSSLALARALDWAIINRMDVINMSVRGRDDELVTRLIRKAFKEGITVVAATDLTNGQLDFPAKLAEVVAVSDQESNSLVGLAAHSQRIFIAPGEEVLTTLPNSTYDFVSGASFAAAHVSGIIALLLEVEPALKPKEVISLLRSSVRIINWGIVVDSCQALIQLGRTRSCDTYWR
ncbi:MAG: S8 family serine peptidase [Pseudomonadota bacterium]